MPAISPKLPLTLDGEYGAYRMNKTYFEVVKQNFKNLILTVPGERMMDPNFGVGLLTYLFEPDTRTIRGGIVDDIDRQTQIYMPFVEVVDIIFSGHEDNPNAEPGVLAMKIRYKITPLSIVDFLEITIK